MQENAGTVLITREEYRRIWQILEELENLMWAVKSQNEGELQEDE